MTGITAERDAIHLAIEDRCSHCGTELADDQEWCHHCGAARTLIHHPPDWRIGIAIVSGVAVVAVLIFVLVLSNLSTSSPSAPSLATVSTPGKHAATGSVSGWPVGLGGWTVSLGSSGTRQAADARARKVAANGVQVGVLDSALHPSLKPGRFIIFSGRYPTRAQASAAATQLVSLGHARAHALLVGRPA